MMEKWVDSDKLCYVFNRIHGESNNTDNWEQGAAVTEPVIELSRSMVITDDVI